VLRRRRWIAVAAAVRMNGRAFGLRMVGRNVRRLAGFVGFGRHDGISFAGVVRLRRR
jgi:hypothetical protein